MAHDKTKAAARKRMAETGEPYAAARRAVVTEHGAAEHDVQPPGAGYRLRMSGEIRDWLAGLRDADPAAAMVAGQALAALMSEGDGLGAPLVVSTADSWPWALAEALDQSYQESLEGLTFLRLGEADAVSLGIDLRRQARELESMQAKLTDLYRRAMDEGNPQEAAQATEALAAAQREATEVERLLTRVIEARDRLSAAIQRRQGRISAFQARKDVLKASYIAAHSSLMIHPTIAASDRGGANARQHEGDEAMSTGPARLLRDVIAQMERELGQQPWPEGLMELRTGSPGGTGIRILFAADPPGTVLLIAVLEDETTQDQRTDAILLSADMLHRVRAGQAPEATAHSYDTQSFLDEFYPVSAGDAHADGPAQ